MTTESPPRSPIQDAGWEKILPWVALFVRLSMGLFLLNLGLAVVLAGPATVPGTSPPGWGPPPNPTGMAGFEGLVLLLPFAALAVGVGLVFGIFTTINALAACGLALVLPVLLTARMLMLGGLGVNAGYWRVGPYNLSGQIGTEEGLASLVVAFLAVPSLSILVLLSPVSINRISVDSLIFGRPTLPPDTPAQGPTGVETTAPPPPPPA